MLAERTTFTDAEGHYRFEDPSRQWLVVPVEVETSTVLHQTVTVNVQVAGPLLRRYLPLIMRR